MMAEHDELDLKLRLLQERIGILTMLREDFSTLWTRLRELETRVRALEDHEHRRQHPHPHDR